MRMLLAAIAAALLLLGGFRLYSSAPPPSASFVFDESAFAETPEDVAAALGGPLTGADVEKKRSQALSIWRAV